MSAINTKTTLIDTLTTHIFWAVRKKMIDAVTQVTPLLDYLSKSGKIKGKVPDGSHWEVPIKYAEEDQNVGYFARGDLAGTAEKETATRLMFYARNVWGAIVRYWQDDLRQVGEAKLIDYAQSKIDGAKDAKQTMLETDLHTASSDPNAINGLDELVAEDPTSGTLGTITRSGNTYLQNQYKDCSALTTTNNLLDEMERMFNLCSVYKGGNQRNPDFILTSRTLFQDYKRIARAMGTLEFDSKFNGVDLGIKAPSFNGVPIMWTSNCQADRMYLLNTETLEFLYHPQAWFSMTPWKPLQGNSLDRTAQIVSVCNLTCNNPIKNGVMFDWTTQTS